MSFAESASVAPSAASGLPRATSSFSRRRRSDAEEVGGKVALAERLEVDLVGRLQLALLLQRLRGEPAELLEHRIVGVGLAKAERIVKYRAEKGPFQVAEDLKKVQGIGAATFEHNKTNIRIKD